MILSRFRICRQIFIKAVLEPLQTTAAWYRETIPSPSLPAPALCPFAFDSFFEFLQIIFLSCHLPWLWANPAIGVIVAWVMHAATLRSRWACGGGRVLTQWIKSFPRFRDSSSSPLGRGRPFDLTLELILLSLCRFSSDLWRKKFSMKSAKYFSDISANHENTTALNVFYVITSG